MAKKTYLLVYSDKVGTTEKVKQIVDTMGDVLFWYRCLPNSFFLSSEKTAGELSDQFRKLSNETGRFLLINVTDAASQGWLPKDAWTFIRSSEPF